MVIASIAFFALAKRKKKKEYASFMRERWGDEEFSVGWDFIRFRACFFHILKAHVSCDGPRQRPFQKDHFKRKRI